MDGQDKMDVSDSRFHMWRAVFAMAHLDGKVTPEEIKFAEKFLKHVPFSEEQVNVLKEDLATPQNVNEMLVNVSDKSDEADFFQFAQMMAWCDGNLDETERVLIERLTAEQMNRFNKEEIAENIRKTRKAATVRRALEDDEFKRQAKEAAGVANMFKADTFKAVFYLMKNREWPEMEYPTPDEATFNLWRGVFGLAHADREVNRDERNFIEGIMEVFNFSPEQRNVIAGELKEPPYIPGLFDRLDSAEMRQQFFRCAHAMVWSDGELHEDEKNMLDMLRLRTPEEELAACDAILAGEDADDEDEPDMMKSMLISMNSFLRRDSDRKAA